MSRDKLLEVIADCGASSTATWQHHRGDQRLATLYHWAGRPQLNRYDHVGLAAALVWVAYSFEECGVRLSLDDGTLRTQETLSDAGRPRGDLSEWLCTWLLARAWDLLERYEAVPLLVSVEDARFLLGQSLARALQVIDGTSDRAALIAVRAGAGLDSERAAAKVGWTARQWQHAESQARGRLDATALGCLGEAFGLTRVQLSRIRNGDPATIAWPELVCPRHRCGGSLTLVDESIWTDPRRVLYDSWLHGGYGAVAACTLEGCGRRYGLGAGEIYLLVPDIELLDGGPRRRVRQLAEYLLGGPTPSAGQAAAMGPEWGTPALR